MWCLLNILLACNSEYFYFNFSRCKSNNCYLTKHSFPVPGEYFISTKFFTFINLSCKSKKKKKKKNPLKSQTIQCINTTASITAQKMMFSVKDFFSKYEQIRSFLRFSPHLLKKSLTENFILCAAYIPDHKPK